MGCADARRALREPQSDALPSAGPAFEAPGRGYVGRRRPRFRAEVLAHQQVERRLVADHDVARRLDLALPRRGELEHDRARAHVHEALLRVRVRLG